MLSFENILHHGCEESGAAQVRPGRREPFLGTQFVDKRVVVLLFL